MPQILVVDDDHGIRTLIRDVLVDAGCAVLTARDATEALRLIERGRPDVLVLDLSLPDGDERALHRVTEAAGPTRVLVLSGSAEVYERARELGAGGALEKPFDIDELVEAVERLTGNLDARPSPGDENTAA